MRAPGSDPHDPYPRPDRAERDAALAHLRRARHEAPRSPRIPAGVQPRDIETGGVVGFGTMGRGIALCFANAGIPVRVVESSDEAWRAGTASVAGSLSRAVARGRIEAPQAERRVARITRADGFEDLGAADFIVEAVFEDLAMKEAVFRKLDRVAALRAVLATNTSSLDVNRIAAATARPEAVLGAHFFSPAHAMPLLEVVVGDATSPVALQTALGLGCRLGKVPVPVGVCDGFVGNRMLYALRGQADALLLEGALPERVDGALTGFGFRMGPFAVADLAGLDIGHAVQQRIAAEKIARGEPPPEASVADRLAELGRFGQKTRRGFYRYQPGDRTPHPDPDVAAIVREESAARGLRRRRIPTREIVERSVFALVDEGARILAEGIASRESDLDVVWTLGYGFPAERGGPMWFARNGPGLEAVASAMRQYARRSLVGARPPSEALLALADAGR